MISIKKYNHKLQYEWDEFIVGVEGGTIFHLQKFLSYHIERKFRDFSLMFYESKKLVGVLPAALLNKNNSIYLSSHPGASFGGFVIDDLNHRKCLDILRCFKLFCIKNNISHFSFTLSPKYYYKNYNDILEYALLTKGFAVLENYISHIILLNDKKEALLYLNKRKQRYVKSVFLSSQEYTITTEGDIREFYSILTKSKKQFNAKPTHSSGEIIKLLRLFPESIKVFFTYRCGVLVGGSMLFKTSKNSALLFYNIVMQDYKNKHISTYQIYHCIEWCLSNQIFVFDLGVSHLPNDKNPLKPKLSLIKFKEQFSAIGVIRKVYRKNYYINK